MLNKIKYYLKRSIYRIFKYKSIYGSIYLNYMPDSINSEYLYNYKKYLNSYIMTNKLNNNGDISRLFSIILNCKQVFIENVKGDIAEVGVWRGNTASILVKFAAENDRKIFLFDTFKGFDDFDIKQIDKSVKKNQFSDTSLELVKNVIGKYEKCIYEVGYFPETIKEYHKNRIYSVVSIDCDLYEPIKSALSFFYPRMANGGLILMHDYSSGCWPGSFKAINEFFEDKKEKLILLPDKSGSAFVRVINGK